VYKADKITMLIANRVLIVFRDLEWTVNSPHDINGTDKSMMKKFSGFLNKQAKSFATKPSICIQCEA
jgi:hypothetical protein